MKKKTLLSVFAFLIMITAFNQKATIELTFTAVYFGQNIPINSILIENLLQGGDTTLYAPDTVLVLDYITSIENGEAISEGVFDLSQNHPNPFNGKTGVNLYLTEKGHVKITVRDILGSELTNYENTLNQGNHSFAFYSANEKYYLLTVTTKQTSKTIKMLNANSNTTYAEKSKIVYSEYNDNVVDLKSQKAINNFGFTIGDELKYTCNSEIGERTIIDSPTGDETYTFQYTEHCTGMPTITDIDGNTYNTVQFGIQCWMAENLKTTTYQNGTNIPNVSDDNDWHNLTTGAYVWYDNDIFWKDKYGALFNWYTTIDSNGLCPTGWHVPSHDEWTALIEFLGGYSSTIGNELKSCRQINSPLGGNCNTIVHPRWAESSTAYGTDDYGFSGLPGGGRASSGFFGDFGSYCHWWTSTETSPGTMGAWTYSLLGNSGIVMDLNGPNKKGGYSIRCLRDN